MQTRKGQIAIGWIITAGIFMAGVIFGGGKIVESVSHIGETQIKQDVLLQQLVKNETDISILLGRHDERIKTLEAKK
mgnify:FL=1